MAGDVAIRIRDVSHQFGEKGDPRFVQALLDTSLEIARGELLCLIGPSGCGKSTLLGIIGGLTEPSSGTVEVGHRQVRGPLPQEIAYVFQENALFPWSTVIENVKLGMMFLGVPKIEREKRAHRSLETVGLAEFADYYPGQLSGGMRQRAALARALSLETGILLMDEPFGALDEQTRMVLGEDLSVLLSRTDKTIVFVTHSLGEAVFLADRVAVFSARPGRIKEIIEVDEPHPRKPDFITSEKFTRIRKPGPVGEPRRPGAVSDRPARVLVCPDDLGTGQPDSVAQPGHGVSGAERCAQDRRVHRRPSGHTHRAGGGVLHLGGPGHRHRLSDQPVVLSDRRVRAAAGRHHTIAGFGYIDKIFIVSARSMGASNYQLFRWVLLPAAFPVIVTGLRMGFTVALLAILGSETIASLAGLGHRIVHLAESMDMARMFAYITFAVAIAAFLNAVVSSLEAKGKR